MTDQNKNSKEITEKNLAIASRLKSGEKVVISEVNGRQRFYTTFSDGSCVAFEMDSGDNGYSIIDISEDGYEFNITKDFDHSWTISEDEQRYIRDNINNYFIDCCSDIKTRELKGEIVTPEDTNKLKTLQKFISNQNYSLESVLNLINSYAEKLSASLDEDKRLGINNKALVGATGSIPVMVASAISKEIGNNPDSSNIYKLMNELALLEKVNSTYKGLAFSVIRDKYKDEYKSFFNNEECEKLPLQSRVLPIVILGRDINSKDMYNECVTRLSDTLILAKKENQLGVIVDEYTSIIYDMLNSGNKLNMQIGPMLNPMRPLINCIEEPSDFFICSDSISKNIPEFSTTELNSRSIGSKEVIDFYAKSNMITELNESKKLQVIFSQPEAQKQLIDSYLNSFKETVINRGLDGGSFLTGFNETTDVLYKLNPKIFMECYSNTIGASIDGTPIQQSLAKQYEVSLKSLNAEQLIQESVKMDKGSLFFDKNEIICEEFFKRSKKELNKENISSLLYTMVSSGTNSDFIRQFFDKVKNYGFNVTDIVKLTMKNINERNDLESFVKELLINNLYQAYNSHEILKIEGSSFIRRGRLQNNRKSIEELKNKITKEIKSKPARVKDEHGKTLIVSLYDQKSIELYFQQEEKSCEILKNADKKSYEDEIAKLEKNKMIIQNLGILVTKDDTEIKPVIKKNSHVAKIAQKAMDKADLTKSCYGF